MMSDQPSLQWRDEWESDRDRERDLDWEEVHRYERERWEEFVVSEGEEGEEKEKREKK